MTEAAPDYAELPLGVVLEMVASREPAPGGGASAAIAVALAAALSSMAARFATDYLSTAEELSNRAEELRGHVMPLARADAEAYGRVLDAYRAPRDDEELREYGIQTTLSEAANVPLAIAELGAEVVGIATQLAHEGNPNLRGDAVTSALLAGAGVRAAVTLVEINISAASIDDERLSRARQLLSATDAGTSRLEIAGGG